MHIDLLYLPNKYENPVTSTGRARTIAAFHIALGDSDTLSTAEMRRDVLTDLMSARAVGYWLNTQNWLERSRKIKNIQMLRLTSAGLTVCRNSLAGGSNIPTTLQEVQYWRQCFRCGKPGFTEKRYQPLDA